MLSNCFRIDYKAFFFNYKAEKKPKKAEQILFDKKIWFSIWNLKESVNCSKM